MEYVGIDWGYGRAAWCARLPGGDIVAEGLVPADADGLLRLVHRLGPEVKGCVEMMSGAVWVRDQLAACGWQIEIADARKAKALAPLAAETDKGRRSSARRAGAPRPRARALGAVAVGA